MKYGYKNGEKSCIGPSYKRGGYAKYNWCGSCTAVWDKTIWRCEFCHHKLRASRKQSSRTAFEMSNYETTAFVRRERKENAVRPRYDQSGKTECY